MTTIIAKTASGGDKAFQGTIDYSSLPKAKLIECFNTAITAHRNFFNLWQDAARQHFGDTVADEMTAKVYPNLEVLNGDLEQVFYEELNFLWLIIADMKHMLTFAHYDASLLPATLDSQLDKEALSEQALVLLWNLSTLTYVMQTSRWVEVVTARADAATALKLEYDVWVNRGGAEEDLRYGLVAAGQQHGDVETLLRGFQMAPGEVGLVDAEFTLGNPGHGWITHRRCPAHDRFRDTHKERLENSCVICVVAMRLSGEMVNKDIRCCAASLPPHKDPQGHACRWEYWIEQ